MMKLESKSLGYTFHVFDWKNLSGSCAVYTIDGVIREIAQKNSPTNFIAGAN